jgi:hypothetical protein
LLVEQSEFNNLLQQFYARDDVRAAIGAMEDYVEEVQRRNTILAQYNALVSEYLRLAGEYRTISAQKEQVRTLQADASAPNLLAATGFASALYHRTRETCIQYAYDACRSYRFWALTSDQTFYETFKLGTPGAMDHQFLSGVAEKLEFEKVFSKIKDNLQKVKNRTPPEEEKYTGTGVCVMFRQNQYPREFRQLREDGVARFAVPLPKVGFERFRLQLVPSARWAEFVTGRDFSGQVQVQSLHVSESTARGVTLNFFETDWDKFVRVNTQDFEPIVVVESRSAGPHRDGPRYRHSPDGPAWKTYRCKALRERLNVLRPYFEHRSVMRSAARHPGFDLRLLPSPGDASGIPKGGRDLILVSAGGEKPPLPRRRRQWHGGRRRRREKAGGAGRADRAPQNAAQGHVAPP